MSENQTPAAPAPEDALALKSNAWVRIGIVALVLALIGGAFSLINLSPDLSHLDVTLLSGSEQGHYHHVVDEMADYASRRHGKVKNLSTQGSGENVQRLIAGADDDETRYALVQDGLELPADAPLELVARLTSPETVFFLARDGDARAGFAQLKGKIGIGPAGSGTAIVARSIFASPGFDGLKVELVNHSIAEQVDLLTKGELDAAVFVIHQDAALIRDAVTQRGLQVCGFSQVDAVARNVPALHAGLLPVGVFDPVKNLPPTAKPVLQVDTLVLSDGSPSRSETVSLLTLLQERFPGFVQHNRETANTTGVPMADESREFFDNGGPQVMDEYAPWLVDLIPLSNLVHVAMAISILFNLMGTANRFVLWRLDAGRIELERQVHELFGRDLTVAELRELEPIAAHRDAAWRGRLDDVITAFDELGEDLRKQSTGFLVPMGREMVYRYQESLTDAWLGALRNYRSRLEV